MTNQEWVDDQIGLYDTWLSETEYPITHPEPGQLRDELLAKLWEIAQNSFMACKAREWAIKLATGIDVDLGCVMP